MRLTAEQRYRQATIKARLISHREVRQLLAGEIDMTSNCTMDLERRFIIAEIQRAMDEQP